MSTNHAAPAEQVMPGEGTPGTEIAARAASSPHALERMPLMTDDEIRRSWRLAGALSASGMFKDARQAEQAFAKILVGRDLGLTPTQALMGLHFVEGKIEIAAVMMATFVRSRPGYDYRQAWIKETPAARQGERAVREAVFADEDNAADMRAVVGCAIEFYDHVPEGGRAQDGDLRGVSRWTIEDSERAGLTRDRGSAKSNHVKYPRNMFFARAVSNGCKWIVPEVLAGLQVYVEGEVEAQKALGDGTGDGQPVGLDLGPDVEKVIARATAAGHPGLGEEARGAIEMLLGDQPPAKVVAWVKAANRELDAIPADAEVVEAAEGVLSGEPGQTPEPKGEPAAAAQAGAHAREASEYAKPTAEEQAAADELGHTIVSQSFLDDGPPRKATPKAVDPARIEALRRRGVQLLDDAEALRDAGDPRADEVFEEFERVSAEVEAASNADQLGLAL